MPLAVLPHSSHQVLVYNLPPFLSFKMQVAFQQTISECITPAHSVTSVQSSVLSKRYVHRLLKASLFNIIYRRLPVNETEITLRKYEDIPFVVHKYTKHEIQDRWFSMFSYWLPAIKEALKKDYLKILYMFLKNADNNIIEAYRFDLKYKKKNLSYKIDDKRSPTEVKIATKGIFEAIHKLSALNKLGADTTLEIEFVTNNCPINYQPPRCEPTEEPKHKNLEKFTFLGDIDTGFHKLFCRSSGVKIHLGNTKPIPVVQQTSSKFLSGKENTAGSSAVFTNEDFQDHLRNAKRKFETINIPDEEEEEEIVEVPRKKFNNSNITVSDRNDSFISDIMVDDVADKGIACICKLQAPDNTIVIYCDTCKQPYHAACLGYFDEDPDRVFTCPDCTNNDKPLKSSKKKPNVTTKLRLILACIAKTGHIPKEIINSMNDSDKAQILDQLKKYQLCEPESTSLSNCDFRWLQIQAFLNVLQTNDNN